MFTHKPSHSVSPCKHDSSQLPAEHNIPGSHLIPHPPQCALSVSSFTHVPLHSVNPVWHDTEQVPFEHSVPD